MLIQAGDKRLSPHEETLEQRAGKTDLFRGTNVTLEERRQIKEKEEKANDVWMKREVEGAD